MVQAQARRDRNLHTHHRPSSIRIMADDLDHSDTEEVKQSRGEVKHDPAPIEKTEEFFKGGGFQKVNTKAGAGEGWESPVISDEVSVHYYGTLHDGTESDSSLHRETFFTLELGPAQTIKGWDRSVPTLKNGELVLTSFDNTAGRRGLQEMGDSLSGDSSCDSRSDPSRSDPSSDSLNESSSTNSNSSSHPTYKERSAVAVAKNYREHRRQRLNGRTLTFYKMSFGFQEPFRVVLDGTFVHFVQEHSLSFEDSLSTLLGGSANIFVTRCVKAELEKLASVTEGLQRTAFLRSAHAARRIAEINCCHETGFPALDCLAILVGVCNVNQYFVATVDEGLRKLLRQVSGVALIHASGASLALEPPSTTSTEYARKLQLERNSMSRSEKDVLRLGEEKKQETCGHKRKLKAKGPNPLSTKRKKTALKTKSQKRNEKKKARWKKKIEQEKGIEPDKGEEIGEGKEEECKPKTKAQKINEKKRARRKRKKEDSMKQ